MSDKQKSLAKVLAGLLALFGAATGVEAAGMMPDGGQLEQLGTGTGIGVILYLHLVWLPLVKRMDGKLDALAAAPVPPVSDEEPPTKRRTTQPHLVAVKPGAQS